MNKRWALLILKSLNGTARLVMSWPLGQRMREGNMKENIQGDINVGPSENESVCSNVE